MRKFIYGFLVCVFLFAGCDFFVKDEPHHPSEALYAYPTLHDNPNLCMADGRRLLFERVKADTLWSGGDSRINLDSTGIWLLDLHTGALKILSATLNDRQFVFSPDCQSVIYVSGNQIWKAPFEQDSIRFSDAVQLTTFGNNHSHSWSPNGDVIAFTQSNCGSQSAPIETCGVNLINSDGSGLRFILRGGSPKWQPVNSEIFIFRPRDAQVNELAIYDLTLHRVTKTLVIDDRYGSHTGYAISPDGSRIVYTNDGSLWSMNAQGGDKRRLTDKVWATDPQWTPDGRLIYLRDDNMTFDVLSSTIWIMDADGRNKRQLTKNHSLVMISGL